MTELEDYVRDKLEEVAHDAEWIEKNELFSQVRNLKNWKLPTNPKTFTNEEEAKKLYDAIVFFCGGAEMHEITQLDVWMVTSKGYYHYIKG